MVMNSLFIFLYLEGRVTSAYEDEYLSYGLGMLIGTLELISVGL